VTGGTVITEEGWLGIYPYSRRADEEIPNLSEGQEVKVLGAEILSKETQPPGQGARSGDECLQGYFRRAAMGASGSQRIKGSKRISVCVS